MKEREQFEELKNFIVERSFTSLNKILEEFIEEEKNTKNKFDLDNKNREKDTNRFTAEAVVKGEITGEEYINDIIFGLNEVYNVNNCKDGLTDILEDMFESIGYLRPFKGSLLEELKKSIEYKCWTFVKNSLS